MSDVLLWYETSYCCVTRYAVASHMIPCFGIRRHVVVIDVVLWRQALHRADTFGFMLWCYTSYYCVRRRAVNSETSRRAVPSVVVTSIKTITQAVFVGISFMAHSLKNKSLKRVFFSVSLSVTWVSNALRECIEGVILVDDLYRKMLSVSSEPCITIISLLFSVRAHICRVTPLVHLRVL